MLNVDFTEFHLEEAGLWQLELVVVFGSDCVSSGFYFLRAAMVLKF